MIGYLKGQLLAVEDGRVILGVGSAQTGWTGYSVSIPARPHYQSLLPEQAAEFHIYTHVREDALDLFGFASPAEKSLFLVLTSVSGIGPKSGLGILSNIEPALLLEMIMSGDSAGLTRLPGIGKKTAERIVLELSDSLKKRVQAGEFSSLLGGRRGSAAASGHSKSGSNHSSAFEKSLQDACEALIGLGYRESEANRVLSDVLAGPNPPQSAEALIRAVLKQQVI